MILPLPPGIERDDTVHGKLYYTRQQMITYGQECHDYGREREYKMHKSATPSNDVVNDLFSKLGVKK